VSELEALGLEPEELLTLRSWLAQPRGLILVTGQRGAGATTTHYACLRHLLAEGRSVSTAEQPIHASLPGASQFGVDSARGRSMATVARDAIGVEAEVTLIGLICDSESAQLVLAAAKDRLVISLLWDVDPKHARERLSGFGSAAEVVEGRLLGVLYQSREASSVQFRLLSGA